MFGTFKAEAKSVEFTDDGVRVTNVAPNALNTEFMYHIMIPFVEMQTISICIDTAQPLVCLRPTRESTDKIQDCLALGHSSVNGLLFDSDSDDPREQKIIIVLSGEKMTDRFAKLLFRQCIALNANCKCERMDISDARLVINAARERAINIESKSQRFNRLILSANDTGVDRPKSLNPSPVSASGRYRYAPTTSSVVTDRSPLRNRLTRASLPITLIVQTVIDLDDGTGGHISGQPVVHLVPISPQQFNRISSNTSPNLTTVPVMKCEHCGQIASALLTAGRPCGHCSRHNNTSRLQSTPVGPNRRLTTPTGASRRPPTCTPIQSTRPSIATKLFYPNNGPVVSRGNAGSRLSVSSIQNVNPMSNCDTRMNRTLSPSVHRLPNNSLLRQSLSKPDCIDLDEEIIDKQMIRRLSAQEECIEINDNEEDRESIPGSVSVQCSDADLRNVNNTVSDNQSAKEMEVDEVVVTRNSESSSSGPKFPITSFPDYIMFGTFKAEAKSVEFTDEGIRVTNVAPNAANTKFKYHIMIPFVEMQTISICIDSAQPLMCLQPTRESTDKIQECMALGHKSENGLRFDTDSDDPREQKIIIVLLGEKMTDSFANLLLKQCLKLNANCKCERMDISDARLVINAARERAINLENKTQRFNRLIQSANDTSGDRSKSINPSPVSATGRYSSRYAPTSSVVTGRSPLRNRSTRASLPITPIVQTVIDLDDDEDVSADQTVDHSLESIKSSVIFTYPKDEPNAIQIVGNDMLCLNKGEFLNDNIVNFYLRHYYKEVLDKEMAKRCHIFDTLFFMQLTEKRGPKRKNPSLSQSDEPYTFDQRYEKKLKNWTKNVDLFSKDFLVFPIIRESHWFVAIVCYPSLVLDAVSTLKTCDDKKPITEFDAEAKESRKACILFMDSLGNASYKKPLSEPIRHFLAYEWKAKKGSDVIAFNNRNKFRDYAPKVPVQTNSSDCGLFVLEYIKEFLKSPDDLAPKLMDYRKGLKKWFASEGIKANRAAIRLLVLERVANETIRQSLEDMIDDSKDSDDDNDDDNDEERDKSVKDGETTAATEDEDQVEGVLPDELGMEVDKCCGTDSRPPSPPTPTHRPDRAEARDSQSVH